MTEGNGKPAAVEQGIVGGEYTLTITWKVSTDEFNVTGLNVPPWAALGMLKYMEIMVRRRDVENAMAAMAANAPRIAIPGGPL